MESPIHGFKRNFFDLKNEYAPINIYYYYTILPSVVYILWRFSTIKLKYWNDRLTSVIFPFSYDIEILLFLIIILAIPPYLFTQGIQIYISYLFILSSSNSFLTLKST